MSEPSRHPDIYTSIDALRRLRFSARGFSFLPKQPVNSALSGKNVSKLRGRGLDFAEMRLYQHGDDIRCMDWKVTMRTGKPHVKVYNEERERNVFLLVDQRLNMFFGSKGKMKSVIAAEIAALTAWNVLDSTDRVGAIVFNDNSAVTHMPKRSQHQVIQILGNIVEMNHELGSGHVGVNHSDSLNAMFAKLLRVAAHDGVVILISDGRGWNDKTTEYIKRLRQHNDMIFCHVTDSLEMQMPRLESMILSDGDLQLEVSRQDTGTFESARAGVESQLRKLAELASKFRIPVVPIDTMSDSVIQLRKAMGSINALS